MPRASTSCSKARSRKRASVRAGFGPAEFAETKLLRRRVSQARQGICFDSSGLSAGPLPAALRPRHLPAGHPLSRKSIALPAPRHRECPLFVRPDAGGMEGAWNLHRAGERQGRPPAD
jgi:hypothetical protein